MPVRFVVALVLAAAPFATVAASGEQRISRPAVVCASGYHVDRGGNCQPDIAQLNRYCAPGLVFHPTFDGWRCDPAPPGYD